MWSEVRYLELFLLMEFKPFLQINYLHHEWLSTYSPGIIGAGRLLTLVKWSDKTNLKIFAAGVFLGMCDLLSPDIKKGLMAEKNYAQDKFIFFVFGTFYMTFDTVFSVDF